MAAPDRYRIMGIDPGTNYMGYGVLEVEGRRLHSVVLGDIDLHKLPDPYAKLRYIFERVGALIDQYGPQEVALESPFFGENVQSMLKLGRAQGVAMAAALSRSLPVFEYAPSRIKRSIAGSGLAGKEQVAGIVRNLLKIEPPRHGRRPLPLLYGPQRAQRGPGPRTHEGAGRRSESDLQTGQHELGAVFEATSRPGDQIRKTKKHNLTNRR